ncbi:apolipo protein O-domain-containing protein [Xylaria bambusicola]|uniref:apolipo protein O-domain-containing protein n=1 Tax=Xylaria bambusicola TaxID=326684 RepID=UPI0020079DD0|nr:apolipo protein O-domain-containing protein [Xylaria bambusicola]KAI0506112.1 apolipo protein O-domain-containing protein [Xylaria bambusicola]
MAARVLLRQRVAAPFMAATLVGGALFPSVALAEAPPQQIQDHQLFLRKKPIYDDFEDTPLPKSTTPVPSPTSSTIPASSKLLPEPVDDEQHIISRGPTPTDRLAEQIGKVRLFLYKQAVAAEDGVNAAVDKAFHLEKSFTSTIASLAPTRESGEQLMPGLVYVLVASMAGSIMTRNRNILLRASLPLALGIGAGWVVIPVTMGNVSDLLWTYEQRFPAVAETHVRTRESIQHAWHMTTMHTELGKNYIGEKVGDARDVVEGWVKNGKK